MAICVAFVLVNTGVVLSATQNQCAVVEDMGCFADSADHRVLSHTAAFGVTTKDYPTVGGSRNSDVLDKSWCYRMIVNDVKTSDLFFIFLVEGDVVVVVVVKMSR